ncbi:hypothetical protein HanXRQr2_Chr15g0689931 [Helianthus annuus]|uniref:Uncharacterized protein n=1 Tax=Helianthus annuus TaxID=4232 RepID=A0A9K3DZQ4_HELAN|nr:hypothetical protein HanXRQr2_Chr15g0689931 [Helianthus annuus]KAJ0830986.1 hypothetical protein HanPSC8_Chr15g0661791 [Helianthus annuus]
MPALLTRAFTVVNGSSECCVPIVKVFSLLENPWLNSAPTAVLVNGLTVCIKEAMRSEVVKLRAPLYLVKLPVAVSNETSVPSANVSFPATPEKLTTGLAVKPMLVLIPAYSCKY